MRTVTPRIEYRVHRLGLVPPVLLESLDTGRAIANLVNVWVKKSLISFVIILPFPNSFLD